MKKLISFMVLVAMIFSTVNLTAMAEGEKTISCDADVLAVFSEIGLLTTEEIGEANLKSIMTRAGFAQYVAKVLNMQYGSTEVLFTDVPADSFYLGSINALVSAGVLSVSGDLKFNPDNAIKYEEVVKMVVCAAGYGDLAASKGGYPGGYLDVASEVGILDNITVLDKTSLTVGESLQILYNAATAGYCEKVIVGSGYSYEVSEETLLSKNYKIYLQEGVVSAMNGAAVDEMYSAREDEANIDGLTYVGTKDLNENEYLGSFVEFVYRYDSAKDLGQMLYLEKKYPDREEKILSQNYAGFDSKTFTLEYYSNEEHTRKETEALEAGTAIVFNGRPYGGKIADVLAKFDEDYITGSIYLKDVNKDGSFDYILINCYKTFVVTNYSTNTIYNKLKVGEKICTDDYDTVTVRTGDGLTAVLSTTYPYVAHVASSIDGKRLDIILPSKQVQGQLSAIGDDEITVGDEVVSVNNKYYADNSNLWKLNAQVTVLLDSTNEVVYVTEGVKAGEFGIGYIIKSAYNMDDEYITFKAYDYTNGEIKIYKAGDRLIVDGITYKPAEEATALLKAFPDTVDENGKLTITPQVIRFKATEDNIIKEIDTAKLTEEENPDNSLYRVFTYASRPEWIGWAGGIGRFDTTILFDSKVTNVLTIPDFKGVDVDAVTAKDFGNTIPSNLYGDKEKVLIPYKFDSSTLYTDILIYTGTLETKGEYAMMYIDSGRGLNADDEVVNNIKVNDIGTEKIYALAAGVTVPQGVTEGDLVALTTNASGEIVTIERMYDREEMKYKDGANPYGNYGDYIYNLPGYASSYAYRSVGKQLSRGYVYSKVGTLVQFTYEMGNADLNGPGYEMINLSGKPVVVYDSEAREGRKVYTGSLNDITDYKSVGDDCTYMLMASSGNSLKCIYIYK